MQLEYESLGYLLFQNVSLQNQVELIISFQKLVADASGSESPKRIIVRCRWRDFVATTQMPPNFGNLLQNQVLISHSLENIAYFDTIPKISPHDTKKRSTSNEKN